MLTQVVLDNTAIYRIMTDNLLSTSANPQQINQLVRAPACVKGRPHTH